jgi:hypothetical protein
VSAVAVRRRRRNRVPVDLRAPFTWRQSVMSRAWWAAPPVIALMLWLPLAWAVSRLDAGTFRSYWRTPLFITPEFLRLVTICAVACAVGSFAMTQVVRSGSTRRARGGWLLEPGFRRVIYRLYVAGIVITLFFAMLRLGGPGAFASQAFTVLSGGGGSPKMRLAFEPVSGLTSLTQLGSMVAMVEVINLTWISGAPDRRQSRRRLIVVLVYSVVRSLFASERLVFVEVLLPVLVVWGRARPLRSVRQSVLMALAPFLAVFVLVFLFAGTEYFRSYQSYKDRTDDSLMEFSRNRLLGYYATSLNNSALYQERDTPKAPFTMLLGGILDWPGIRPVLGLQDPRKVDAKTLLESHANPEFNNRAPPGFLALEGGWVYIVGFMVGFGAICGAAYAGYRFGSVGGAVWFGFVFVALMEFPRIWYLTSSRMSAPMLAALIGWLRYNPIAVNRRKRPVAAEARA